jgi:CHAD domain-containing protein
MAKRKRLTSLLETTSHDPALRAVAASAVAAGGALAAGRLVRERVTERAQRKRRRYRLQTGETPVEGIGRIARGQLDHTIGLLESPPNGDGGSEAIHEARKSLKRLRALLHIGRPLLGDQTYRHENLILRDAGRELSDTRDAQVLLETLDALRERFAAELPNGAWSRLRESLASAADDAAAAGPDAAAGVLGPLSDTRVRIATWELPRKGGPDSLAKGFERVYRRGRRALRKAESEQSAENLHELRKRAKDLWHGAQLLRSVCPKRMKKLASKSHHVSDLLGDDHDLSVLREYGQAHPELLEPSERELLVKLIGARQEELRREALKRAERLYRRKPKKALHRLALA